MVLRHDALDPLGVDVAVLMAPKGVSVRKALKRLQALDPAGSYDYDHLYFGSGVVSNSAAAPEAPQPTSNSHARIGLIDTGVDAAAPALAAARIQARGFAPDAPAPAAHGTATASLIAGRAKGFSGAAAGANLWAADIYGRAEGGGSAENLARALAWMAEAKVPVVNVSLVGPDNRLLAASIEALQARGQLVIAAVGNDGPAAPPAYPASYAGVIAVSAVDGHGRPLPEAGRALHVDFCAPGADMAAAGPGGFVSVRGTSFAAPLVAGLLAERLEAPDPAAARAAVEAIAHDAKAAAGDRKACGRGLVAAGLRTDPKAVGARPAPMP
jgi:subtilisin family serine protease